MSNYKRVVIIKLLGLLMLAFLKRDLFDDTQYFIDTKFLFLRHVHRNPFINSSQHSLPQVTVLYVITWRAAIVQRAKENLHAGPG